MATLSAGDEQRQEMGRNPQIEQLWYVEGATDRADARATLVSGTPDVLDGLLRTAVTLTEMGDWDNTANDSSWECRLIYGVTPLPDLGQIRISASTKGGRETITQALSTYDQVALTGFTAADTQGAIGVDASGNVAGVEVSVPKSVYSVEIHIAHGLVTNSYWQLVAEMTGTVNASTWKSHRPHELLFLGADYDGTIRLGTTQQQLARIRYDFAAEGSRLRSLGNGVTVQGLDRDIDKRGWDHLEVRYGEFEDTAADMIVRRPIMAWSRQVYPASDFSQLGIGS